MNEIKKNSEIVKSEAANAAAPVANTTSAVADKPAKSDKPAKTPKPTMAESDKVVRDFRKDVIKYIGSAKPGKDASTDEKRLDDVQTWFHRMPKTKAAFLALDSNFPVDSVSEFIDHVAELNWSLTYYEPSTKEVDGDVETKTDTKVIDGKEYTSTEVVTPKKKINICKPIDGKWSDEKSVWKACFHATVFGDRKPKCADLTKVDFILKAFFGTTAATDKDVDAILTLVNKMKENFAALRNPAPAESAEVATKESK